MRNRWLVSCSVALLMASTACLEAQAKRKVILDQDTFGSGGPNQQPLLMALQSPDVEVLGITVESGDGWQDENVAHVLRMLELVHRTDIPVYRGATYPLLNSKERTEAWEKLHGHIAYLGAWQDQWDAYNNTDRTPYHAPDVIPPMREGQPHTHVAEGTAAEFLVRTVRRYPGQVSILGLGPFTNLALAIRLDDHFASNAKELVIQGGGFHPIPEHGDSFAEQVVNTPVADFNTRWDPEAASILLHAGWKHITALTMDATTDTHLTPALLQQATSSKGIVSQYVASYNAPNYPLWDEAAIAIWLDPKVIRVQQKLAMDFSTESESAGYGSTLSWPAGKGPGLGEPDVDVVFRVDVPRLNALFVSLLSKP